MGGVVKLRFGFFASVNVSSFFVRARRFFVSNDTCFLFRHDELQLVGESF